MGSQMGKTAILLAIIGWIMDDDPAPTLYVGPTKSNLEKSLSLRIREMIDGSPLQKKQLAGVHDTKFLFNISGVTLSLGWAGSDTELASQPRKFVFFDEVDKFDQAGDPITQGESRIQQFAGGKIAGNCTPTGGVVPVGECERTGLHFWGEVAPEDLGSKIWSLFQSGTRHHWAIKCAHCSGYTIPRARDMVYPESASLNTIRTETRLIARCCGALMDDREVKRGSSVENGRAIAPGQTLVDGIVSGEPTENGRVFSIWVSGLVSPARSIGDRAVDLEQAKRSGDIKALINIYNERLGECYAVKGDAPTWERVKACALDSYALKTAPPLARIALMTCDVQGDRIYYVIRAWGPDLESWLIDRGQVYGPTDQPDAWESLWDVLEAPHAGLNISAMAIDAGFRKDHVYAFAKRAPSKIYPTKGDSNKVMRRAFTAYDVQENRPGGRKKKSGLKLYIVDADGNKSRVHDRIEWAQDARGAWHLPSDIDEDYCRQIVAESRIGPAGRQQWQREHEDNHYLDCEGQQEFLCALLNVRELVSRPVAAAAPARKRTDYL